MYEVVWKRAISSFCSEKSESSTEDEIKIKLRIKQKEKLEEEKEVNFILERKELIYCPEKMSPCWNSFAVAAYLQPFLSTKSTDLKNIRRNVRHILQCSSVVF